MAAEPASSRLRPPLRVSLLLDGWSVPAWVHAVVADIESAPHADVVLVVLRHDSGPKPGRLSRLWQRRAHLLYELYARLDRKLFPARPDAFERVSLADLLEGRPTMRVAPETSRFSDYFPREALEQIRSHDLDVALRFGFRILRGGVLGVARHGVWSSHHDDNRVIRGGPPGFWEVMEGHDVTGSVLQVLTERLDAGEVLYRSWSPTHRRSVNRNKNHVYWKSAAFVTRKLRHLAETGSAFGDGGCREGYAPYGGRLYRKPTNRELLPHLLRFGARAGWARARDAATRDPRLLELMHDEAVERVQAFARHETPRRFSLLPEEFTVESGLLTPTLKARRRAIEQRFNEAVERLYAEVEQIREGVRNLRHRWD